MSTTILSAFAFLFLFISPVQAQAPITPSTSSYLPSTALLEVKTSISTTDAKSRWIKALHLCENPDNIPWIWDSNGKKSFGAFMFQMRSWLNYKKQGATPENIGDDAMQDKITRYVLDTKGYGDWRTCGRKVSTRLGEYGD